MTHEINCFGRLIWHKEALKYNWGESAKNAPDIVWGKGLRATLLTVNASKNSGRIWPSCALAHVNVDSYDLFKGLEEQWRDVKVEFRSSTYPIDYAFHEYANRSRELKFKEDFSGNFVSQFVCLKQKMFSKTSESKLQVFLPTQIQK